MKIIVNHQPSEAELTQQGIRDWPIWSKEASQFPWYYDSGETCFILEGDVTVTPASGEAVRIGKGDLVTFPAGMQCTWEIHHDIRKHYRFD